MAPFQPHHLPIDAEHLRGNGEHGRLLFLPGSDGRAHRIAERFVSRQVIKSDRQHNVYLGRIESDELGVDVATVSTGMGCASLNIVASELILLGARLLLRVGTAGSLVPGAVRAGSLVIATAAVRDEGASDRYVSRDYPAVGHPELVAALERAALGLGHGERTFRGLVHAKDTLYGVEFGHGPRRRDNEAYLAELRSMRVLASDMETSHLFVLADVHSTAVAPIARPAEPGALIRAGSVLAVVGDDSPYAPPPVIRRTEEAAIEVALEATLELFRTSLRPRPDLPAEPARVPSKGPDPEET